MRAPLSARSYHSNRWNATTALVPPNPKELETATLIGTSRAWFGTTSRSHSGSWLSMLMVGGTTPWRIASTLKAASTPPAAPSRCPVMLLVELTIRPSFAQPPKTFLIAFTSATSPTGVLVPCALTYCTCSGRSPASSKLMRMARRAVLDADLAPHQVDDDRRDEERVHPPVALLHRGDVRLLQGGKTAHPRADDHAAALAQRLVERQPRVLERELRGGQAELDEEVVAARLLLVHELAGIEILHLAGDVAGKVLGVEAGDLSDAALAGEGRFPGFLGPDRQRRDQPEARD